MEQNEQNNSHEQINTNNDYKVESSSQEKNDSVQSQQQTQNINDRVDEINAKKRR